MVRRALWGLLLVAVVVALFVWTPMALTPTVLFFGLVLVPFVVLAGVGVYHVVHGARRPPERGPT